MSVWLLGAGSFAREVAGMCADLNVGVSGYVVDVPGPHDPPVYHIEDLVTQGQAFFLCAIVSPGRAGLVEKAGIAGMRPAPPLIHPSASLARTVHLSGGVIVSRQVAVGSGAGLSFHVIVNRGATVGHDCFLDRFSTVGPGAHLAGGVTICKGATVGMGALVREGVTVGMDAVVGMGSVVLRDVPPGETWWGVPARRMR